MKSIVASIPRPPALLAPIVEMVMRLDHRIPMRSTSINQAQNLPLQLALLMPSI
jgi:hypothetical protein